jgi:hypothetical protein|tara:strand:+ start:997 stop:1260 length:264 start_codon:yes stop_codon:yes gene_type:complete
MKEKHKFGHLSAENLEIGDIVAWSRWSDDDDDWREHMGILLEIRNEIKANRFVSVSKVMPLDSQNAELEFFTLTLRLVSRSKKESGS